MPPFPFPLCRMCICHHSPTMRGILKRKFAEVDDNAYSSSSSSPSPPSSLSSPASSESESDGESGSLENQDFTPRSPASPTSLPSKSSNQWAPRLFFFFVPHLLNNANLPYLSTFPSVFYRSVCYHTAAAQLWLIWKPEPWSCSR